ncbi:MAG: IS110 family transposase [Planctomycetota bacterium]|nr:IS110 family transposase [Planctomycetota bacterium]
MRILALDVGKCKTVSCLLDTDTGEVAYETTPTSPCDLNQLFAARRPDRVVLEVGPMAGWIRDVASASDVKDIQVANPTHEAWRWRNVKRKTDRLDALKLAQLSAANQLPTVWLPEGNVRQWRQLIHYRNALVERRTAIKNNIRSVLDTQGLTLRAGRCGWTAQSLAGLRLQARPLAGLGMTELWRGILDVEVRALEQVEQQVREVESALDALGAADERVQLLQTIPGVGPRLSELLVAMIDDPHRFRSGRQVSSYFGLVPRQHQSGQMDRQGHITRQGCRLARKLLVEVAWVSLRYNPHLRQVYQRVHGASRTRRKIAIVAVARHLAVIGWAMMRDRKAWRPPTAPPTAAETPAEPSPAVRPPRPRTKGARKRTATTTARN